MTNRTLLDAWEALKSCDSKNISLYQSALFRFTLPGLGGRKPSGSRLNSKEIAAALKTLSLISISPDTEERLREAQKETFTLLNTPKKRQRQPRYYLNQFIDRSIKNGFFLSVTSPEEKLQYDFHPEKIKKVKVTRRRNISQKFTFSFDVNNYTDEPLQREQIQQHLHEISQEFTNFKKYQVITQEAREITANNREKFLRRILGWLYQEKGIPLAEINLSKLVPFIRLNFKVKEFSSEENPWLSKIIAQAQALEDIKDEAKRLVEMLKEFFEWLENPPSTTTKQIYVEALITYAKYVYRSETDETMALNFEDIPLINRLKVFSRKLKNGKNNKFISTSKYLPWSEILGVLEKLRFEADLETSKNGKQGKNEIYRRKRSLRSRANSLQRFILLGFFVLVPPSRQRVIRELELGRTLKYGIFEHGRFTSVEDMANPNEAKYYIHLQPEDYKTGDTYKEWLGEFPNTKFPDGSKFYDYLNRWLFRGYQDENGVWHGMREINAAPDERTVFISNKGRAFVVESLTHKIKWIFRRWTGIEITPQDLRHLYRTYIDDPATGATQEEKESAAFWMRHSSKIAAKTYSHLNCEQKLRLGAQMTERLNQQLLNSKALNSQQTNV
jgi:hypothetical protein